MRSDELTSAERADLREDVTFSENVSLNRPRYPEGFNMASPGPAVAGGMHRASAIGHIVPPLETAIIISMPVVGQTRILPQSLELTWEAAGKAAASLTEKAPAPQAYRRKSRTPPPLTARHRSAHAGRFSLPTKTRTFPVHVTSPRSMRIARKTSRMRAHVGVKLVTREDWLEIEAPAER